MPVAKDLTEIVAVDPKRIDRVKSPASGFPVLIMKSAAKDVNSQGGIDEAPDIHGAESVLIELSKLIAAEAREMGTGQWDEIYDIQSLAEAACCIKWFLCREQMGALEEDGEAVKDLAPDVDELAQVFTWVFKRKISAAERKRLASEGHALPDGSYPIETTEDLHNAAILARSGHGDVAAAKRLIAKRAKELGVVNPLTDSASKASKKDDDEDESKNKTGGKKAGDSKSNDDGDDDDKVEKSVSRAVAEAVSKEVKPLQETIKGLESELAALKATPNMTGAPVITAAKATASMDKSSNAEAARFERLSKSVSDRELARYYAERAKEAREGSK